MSIFERSECSISSLTRYHVSISLSLLEMIGSDVQEAEFQSEDGEETRQEG